MKTLKFGILGLAALFILQSASAGGVVKLFEMDANAPAGSFAEDSNNLELVLEQNGKKTPIPMREAASIELDLTDPSKPKVLVKKMGTTYASYEVVIEGGKMKMDPIKLFARKIKGIGASSYFLDIKIVDNALVLDTYDDATTKIFPLQITDNDASVKDDLKPVERVVLNTVKSGINKVTTTLIEVEYSGDPTRVLLAASDGTNPPSVEGNPAVSDRITETPTPASGGGNTVLAATTRSESAPEAATAAQ
jgi:hypothetical protein